MQKAAGGSIDVAIVCGSGLAGGVRARIQNASEIPYAKLGAPKTTTPGHFGIAVVGQWVGRRVVAFLGRTHLYNGATPHDVTFFVRLAAASGARTLVLTNAAGGLDPTYTAGDVMLVADHINLTGASPIERTWSDPFVNMTGAYAPALRDLARDATLREGVYAGVRGPAYETPAECEALRRLGADAVGMSTVLETIAARALGLDVLGLSLITNTTGATSDVSHAEVLAASEAGSERIAAIVERVLAANRSALDNSGDPP